MMCSTIFRRGLALSLRTVGTLVLLGLTTTALSGCRSDGGVGRRDSQRSMRFTLDAVESQYERDVANTNANASELSDWFDGEVSDPWAGVQRTVHLYLEGNAGENFGD